MHLCVFKVHINILAKCAKVTFFEESIFKINVGEILQHYVISYQKWCKYIIYKNIIINMYRKALKLNILNWKLYLNAKAYWLLNPLKYI